MSVPTAFFPRQEALNTKMAWGEWSGYFSVPVYADFHDIEYSAIREAAAVIDVSPLYKYVVSGPDAQRLLDRVMTRDMTKLRVDRVFYSPWCDEDGKVLDDGTIARLDDSTYRITAADPSYRWFVLNATGLDVEIDDVSDRTAALALQGRLSREVLQEATRRDWTDLTYFGRRATEIGGVAVDVTRTGYTGDRGYELWMAADEALPVWDELFEVGERYGIFPVGIDAMDVARVEAGLILIEAEYTSARHAVAPEQQYSPFELGFESLVDLDKGAEFTGGRALRAEHAAGGPERRLVGLELDWAGIEGMFAKHGQAPAISPFVHRAPVPVYKEGKQVGRATSITWGTTIKKMVGFGSVDTKHSKPGTRLSVEWSVEGERGKVAASVVPLPFLDLERKRT
ncbi:MAG TPA: aminomethyltransferase family protein [Actinomycetota bacterium]|nr:aminomethyltransferase family protein [Actinomycetota bacterium]